MLSFFRLLMLLLICCTWMCSEIGRRIVRSRSPIRWHQLQQTFHGKPVAKWPPRWLDIPWANEMLQKFFPCHWNEKRLVSFWFTSRSNCSLLRRLDVEQYRVRRDSSEGMMTKSPLETSVTRCASLGRWWGQLQAASSLFAGSHSRWSILLLAVLKLS